MAPKESYDEDFSPLMIDSVNKLVEPAEELSFLRRVKMELGEQMGTALPTLQSMLLTKIPWLVSLRFVSGIGSEELAAAALATTLCNVTGLSLSVGLSSALTTLAGQAKGELHSRALHDKKRRVNLDLQAGADDEGSTIELTTTLKDNERIRFTAGDDDEEPTTGFPAPKENDTEPLTPLIFLYRGMFIQLVAVIPIGLWWIFGIKDVLVALGQHEGLATMTEKYLRILAPGLWAYSINWTLTAWVQAIGMADVPAYSAVIGLVFHLPFNWFFIFFLDWGYLGCAVATVCFQVIQPIFILTYLFGFAHGRSRVLESTGGLAIGRTCLSFWLEFRLAVYSMRGIIKYLALALPGIVIISEWWASETSIFLSGRLEPSPDAALGGMTLYQSINTFCFMFPVAFSVAASARVSYLLGSGNPVGAEFAAKVGVASAAVASFAVGCVLYLTPHTFIPSLFAPDEHDVILETAKTIPLLAAYVFADGVSTALNGVIKGCGRQRVVMPIVIVAYWVVAVPLAYYLAFVKNNGEMYCEDSYFCGVVGLVAAMTAGTWIHALLLALVVGCTTNWALESEEAKARVAEKE